MHHAELHVMSATEHSGDDALAVRDTRSSGDVRFGGSREVEARRWSKLTIMSDRYANRRLLHTELR